MVETLVQHGASLGLRNKDGWNPFHIACRYCRPHKDPAVQLPYSDTSSLWYCVGRAIQI